MSPHVCTSRVATSSHSYFFGALFRFGRIESLAYLTGAEHGTQGLDTQSAGDHPIMPLPRPLEGWTGGNDAQPSLDSASDGFCGDPRRRSRGIGPESAAQ